VHGKTGNEGVKATERPVYALSVLLAVWLCLYVQTAYALTPFSGIEVANSKGTPGARVIKVAPGSLASQAGIQPGDVIVEIEGTSISSLEDFVEISRGTSGKDITSILVDRQGIRLDVPLGEPAPVQTPSAPRQIAQPPPVRGPAGSRPPPGVPNVTSGTPPGAPPPSTPLVPFTSSALDTRHEDEPVRARLKLTLGAKGSKSSTTEEGSSSSSVSGQADVSVTFVEKSWLPDDHPMPKEQRPTYFVPHGTFSYNLRGKGAQKGSTPGGMYRPPLGDYLYNPPRYSPGSWENTTWSFTATAQARWRGEDRRDRDFLKRQPSAQVERRFFGPSGELDKSTFDEIPSNDRFIMETITSTSNSLGGPRAELQIGEPYQEEVVGPDKKLSKPNKDMLEYYILIMADSHVVSTYTHKASEGNDVSEKSDDDGFVMITIRGIFPKGQNVVPIKKENIEEDLGGVFALPSYELYPEPELSVSGTLELFGPDVSMKETMVRRERIDEELIDEHCPDVFSSKKAYDISVDFAKSEMNITVKIKLETVKATPFRHVRTMKVGGEDVIIYVTPVAAGYVPPIYTTPNPPPPLPLPPVEVSKLALKFIAELWERDIEDRWNKFQLRRFLGGRPLDIKFDVEFVDSGDYHHLVKVHPGNGRSDQSNWFFYDITGTAIDYPDYAPP
jgi:hypothetical protein